MRNPWLGVLGLVLAGCAGRWVANEPRMASVGEPHAGFEMTVATLRSSGYTIEELDPARLYVRVRSRLDGDVVGSVGAYGHVSVVARISWIGFQITPDGRLVATASGFHVREDVMHRRLADEVDGLVGTIVRNLGGRFPRHG